MTRRPSGLALVGRALVSGAKAVTKLNDAYQTGQNVQAAVKRLGGRQ